jgi:hypothetical protein
MSHLRRMLAVAVAGMLVAAGLIGLSGSPAYAGSECRDNYEQNGWDATICTQWNNVATDRIAAQGIIFRHPSNCATYRAYVLDMFDNERLLRSTGRKSCNVQATTSSDVHWSEFAHDHLGRAKGFTRLVAWDSAGREVLVIEGPSKILQRPLV